MPTEYELEEQISDLLDRERKEIMEMKGGEPNADNNGKRRLRTD